MDFKFFSKKEVNNTLTLTNNNRHVNNEFCFQFDNEEPISFANGSQELSLRIQPSTGGDITFTHNGKTFKIFARERQ
jgi:hypothetical protein